MALGIKKELAMSPRNFISKLDAMIRNFRDDKVDEIMVHVGRLGNVGIVFAGVMGIIKYREKIFPSFPGFGLAVGLIGLFLTFILLVAISFGVWKSVHAAIKTTWIGHIFGIAASGFVLLLGVGAIYLAVNA